MDDYAQAEMNRLREQARRVAERNVAKEAFNDYKVRKSEYAKRKVVSKRMSTSKDSN